MISEKLSEIRKSRGYTMKAVAEAIEMKPDTYRNYESGRLEPNLKTLQKLADFYGVTTDYLLGREPLPNPFADLNLSEDDEKEVIEKYLSLPPEIRAMMMNVLRQLGEVVSKDKDNDK